MSDETGSRIAQMNKELEEQLARTAREVEAVVGWWGPFLDDLTAPGAVAMFHERGVKIAGSAVFCGRYR